MTNRVWLTLPLIAALLLSAHLARPVPACCPAPPYRPGDKVGVLPVVNADQTVIIIWDAATKTQHFIRKASFKSGADDFGFLVPTPTQPKLDESGNEAFPYLYNQTRPEIITKNAPRGGSGGVGCGCADSKGDKSAKDKIGKGSPPVKVLEEKLVAGFKAQILETKSATALVNWLKENGYAFSPEVEAWAKPYVENGWLITALKVAKDKQNKENKSVTASALRMTFKTDRPLFPYREPDSRSAADTLGASKRLLRIYFLAEARYGGELTKTHPWTGKVAWAGKLSPEHRTKVLAQLKLPETPEKGEWWNTPGPGEWWLTEFEDDWPYRVAPADVYFSRAANQDSVKRPPIIQYVSANWPTDVTAFAIVAVVVLPPLVRRVRRRKE